MTDLIGQVQFALQTVENLDLLFPKVRAQLLRLLFVDPSRQMYVRELARYCKAALSAVQAELANLVEADLLRSRSDGFHVFYRANRKHPMFVDLQQRSLRAPTPELCPENERSLDNGHAAPITASIVSAQMEKKMRWHLH